MKRFDYWMLGICCTVGALLAVVYIAGCGPAAYVEPYQPAPAGYIYSNDGYVIPASPGVGYVYVGGGQFSYGGRRVYIDRPGHIVTYAPRHVNVTVNAGAQRRSGGFNTSVAPPSQRAFTPSVPTRTSGGFNRSTPSSYSRPTSSSSFSAPSSSSSRSSGGFRR